MRILLVVIPDSVHVARWVRQIANRGWDIHLFPAYDAPPHPDLCGVTFHAGPGLPPEVIHPGVRVERFTGIRAGLDPARRLAEVIRETRPDILHSMELQHCGYLTLDARSHVRGTFPTWIVSNWGSDIFLYGRLPDHAERIRALLALCDYYSCECCRDVALARRFGFRGQTLPVFPVAGGFDLDHVAQFRSPGPTSARRVVALKGYQTWAGRALVGLRALEMCADELQGFRVVVYSGSPDVALAARLAEQATGVPFEVLPPSPHEEMLRLFGRARVYLGLSISDGISTSLLESIVMGAFPVQSCTACADEWVKDGESGLIVPPEDPAAVAAALRRALTDDRLVDRAAERNTEVAARRLDVRQIAPQVADLYRQVAFGGPNPHLAGARSPEPASARDRLAEAEQWLRIREAQIEEQQEALRELRGRITSLQRRHVEKLAGALRRVARGLGRRVRRVGGVVKRALRLAWRGGRVLRQDGVGEFARRAARRITRAGTRPVAPRG